MTDSNRMTDEVEIRQHSDGSVTINGDIFEGAQGDPLPERPSDGARKSTWVDYVVALGADRGFVEADTEHWDDATGEYVTQPGLSAAELRALADSLGG